jgi:hypothetical protein
MGGAILLTAVLIGVVSRADAAQHAMVIGLYAEYNPNVVLALPAATKELVAKCGKKYQPALPSSRAAQVARLAALRLLAPSGSRVSDNNVEYYVISPDGPTYNTSQEIRSRLTGWNIDHIEPMLLDASASWILVWFKNPRVGEASLLPAAVKIVNRKVVKMTFNDRVEVPISYTLDGCTNG